MNSKAVAEYITDWLEAYRASAGSKGFVIGISGGIDSAVCSTLAAMTGRPTLCVTLPIHQPASHVSRAAEHIEFLRSHYPNVASAEADLTGAYETFIAAFSAVSTSVDNDKRRLTEANTRSRLRMVALYYFAGINDMLVVGTGNKIEDFGIGFFTKYGDGGVDISPIADLTKTEVFTLGAYLGVPGSILTAPPTDGLFGDDRTDEQQIGATYPELEWAMQQYTAGADIAITGISASTNTASFTPRQREVLDIFTRRHRANHHKMTLPPYPAIPPEIK